MPAMVAITDEGMKGGIDNPAIVTVRIGAGLAVRVDCLRASAPAFPLGIRHHGVGPTWRGSVGRAATARTVIRRTWPQRPRATTGALRWRRAVDKLGQCD